MTLPNGVEIKFEEIIGLAGDLYGLPENPIIDPFKEEEDFNRKQRFRDANDTLARAGCWHSSRKKESLIQRHRTNSQVASASSAFH